MKKRYIVLILTFVPIIATFILSRYYPFLYDILIGYLVTVAIAFKTYLLSFYSLSKLKLLAFFKSLTLIQAIILLVKRWFLDNVFTRWVKEHIIDHIVSPFIAMAKYYKSLNLRRKILNFFLPLVVTIATFWLVYVTGYLNELMLFTELKVFIIGFSKALLAIVTKIASLIFNSWITPIIEVFALSYLLNRLEEWLGSSHPIIRAINWISDKLNSVLIIFSEINKEYIDPLLNKKVTKKSKKFAKILENYVNDKKIEYEQEQIEKLQNKIRFGHIDAYHYFKGMEDITDKKKLYSLINKRTRDYLNIVGYVSRTKDGTLVDESIKDSYYHDIFILEGVASSFKDGVSNRKKEVDATDFWILNTSNHPVLLLGSDKFEEREIEPKSLTFIKTKKGFDYAKDKICFKFKDNIECAVILDE